MNPSRPVAFLFAILALGLAGRFGLVSLKRSVPTEVFRVASSGSNSPPTSRSLGNLAEKPPAVRNAVTTSLRPPSAHDLAKALEALDSLPSTKPTEVGFAAFHTWLKRETQRQSPRRNNLGLDPHIVAEGIALASQRRNELLGLIQSNPRRALELALPDALRHALPPAIAELLEEHLSGHGDLEVLCAYPDGDRVSVAQPLLRFANLQERRLKAHVYGNRSGDPTLRGVTLEGIALAGHIALAEKSEPQATDAAAGTDPGGTSGVGRQSVSGLKRLILIRVDFSDLPGASFSTNTAAQMIRDVHRFMDENSYGRAGFRLLNEGSAVTPVLRLPRTAASYGGPADANGLRTDARAAARTAGYVLTDFDYDVICMAGVSGFNWSGLGFVGAPGAWIRGTSSAGVTAHELGHNLGLLHANFWSTGGDSVTGAGTSIEYGDKFDTMGAANAGNYHFNARYKRLLGWLKPGEFTVATTNGIYRIYAHDQTNAVIGSRGLQIFANAQTNYWLEFRQRFTGNAWLMNGASLRWAGRANESSLLLDTTPGSSREKDDSAILIGQTFTDPLRSLHFTPLAKGGADPAWLDILVQRGAFPSNHPPSLSLTAPQLSGTTATSLNFAANTTDADGDALSFYWDFSDESIGENRPEATHRWSANGEFVVRCTASDGHGGVARASVLVRIGNPTASFHVSGRVTADGEPILGARVVTRGSRSAITDSDGTFILAGLSRGSYAFDASLEGRRFEPVTFNNPVNLTGNLSNLDFAAVDLATQSPVTLLPAGSQWRYWDQGSAPEGPWASPEFADDTWDLGAAILGYGGDKETTVISFGPDSANKQITTWFRRTFEVSNPAALSQVRVGLLRDDGAAVYLNGHEVFRDNLPAGTLTSTTRASSTVSGADETTYFEHDLEAALLVAGTNLLAVEVHQSSPTSSDIAFDLRLTANESRSLAPGLHLTRPARNEVFTAPARVVLSATVGELATGTAVDHVEFFANGQRIATATRRPHTAVWNPAPAGEFTIQAIATLSDGNTLSSGASEITIEDPDLNPMLIPRGSLWRYLDKGVAPEASWTEIDYDDALWATGPARLGYGEDGEFTLLNFGPDSAKKFITTWFRHAFDLQGAETVAELICRLQRDDGGIVYLNGQELFRLGLRTGAITPTILASSDVRDEAEQAFTERRFTAPGLREGRNVLAVEMHQVGQTSSDLGFDLELSARRTALPESPRLAWSLSNEHLALRWSNHFAGWRLESTTDFAWPGTRTVWTPLAGNPVAEGDQLVQSVSASVRTGTAYFRLVRPAAHER